MHPSSTRGRRSGKRKSRRKDKRSSDQRAATPSQSISPSPTPSGLSQSNTKNVRRSRRLMLALSHPVSQPQASADIVRSGYNGAKPVDFPVSERSTPARARDHGGEGDSGRAPDGSSAPLAVHPPSEVPSYSHSPSYSDVNSRRPALHVGPERPTKRPRYTTDHSSAVLNMAKATLSVSFVLLLLSALTP
jgi:hypothetical protein